MPASSIPGTSSTDLGGRAGRPPDIPEPRARQEIDKLGLIENYGTGLLRIREAYENDPRKPEF